MPLESFKTRFMWNIITAVSTTKVAVVLMATTIPTINKLLLPNNTAFIRAIRMLIVVVVVAHLVLALLYLRKQLGAVLLKESSSIVLIGKEILHGGIAVSVRR